MAAAATAPTKAETTFIKICTYCSKKETILQKLFKCAQCKSAFYCNVGCQRAHWPVHRRVCVPLDSHMQEYMSMTDKCKEVTQKLFTEINPSELLSSLEITSDATRRCVASRGIKENEEMMERLIKEGDGLKILVQLSSEVDDAFCINWMKANYSKHPAICMFLASKLKKMYEDSIEEEKKKVFLIEYLAYEIIYSFCLMKIQSSCVVEVGMPFFEICKKKDENLVDILEVDCKEEVRIKTIELLDNFHLEQLTPPTKTLDCIMLNRMTGGRSFFPEDSWPARQFRMLQYVKSIFQTHADLLEICRILNSY